MSVCGGVRSNQVPFLDRIGKIHQWESEWKQMSPKLLQRPPQVCAWSKQGRATSLNSELEGTTEIPTFTYSVSLSTSNLRPGRPCPIPQELRVAKTWTKSSKSATICVHGLQSWGCRLCTCARKRGQARASGGGGHVCFDDTRKIILPKTEPGNAGPVLPPVLYYLRLFPRSLRSSASLTSLFRIRGRAGGTFHLHFQ